MPSLSAKKTYISQRPKLNGHLFCHYSGKPVTRYQFSSVLNKALTFMGISNLMIRSHSFRIGAFLHLLILKRVYVKLKLKNSDDGSQMRIRDTFVHK